MSGQGYHGQPRRTDVQYGPGFFDPEDQEADDPSVEDQSRPAGEGEPMFEPAGRQRPDARRLPRGDQPPSGRRLVVEADGGSRGNPGPAAYGSLVRDATSGQILSREGQKIGVTTNNVAEYSGLIAGLEMARSIDPTAEVEVRMDSKLVVEQMAGRWKIKHPSMIPLARRAAALRPTRVTWTWVPRADNKAADALVNAALDGEPISRDLPAAGSVRPDGWTEAAL